MSRALSDYNDTRATVVTRRHQYSDIDPTFTLHPVYNDIMAVNDLDAIRTSLYNLILTNTYERPFQPQLGSGLTALLFENVDAFTIFAIKDKITYIIQKYEPRVKIISIEVLDNSERNAYQITLTFSASFNRVADVTFYLVRTR